MSAQDMQAASLGHRPHSAAAIDIRRPAPFLSTIVPLNALSRQDRRADVRRALHGRLALGTIGYALTSLNRQMPLDAFWMGIIGSSALIGIFLGSLFFGWLSDRLGRQRIFLTELSDHHARRVRAVLRVLAARIVSCLRVLIGFGMGGDFTVGHAILAEFSPRKHRGTLLGSFSVVWTIGYVAGERARPALRRCVA